MISSDFRYYDLLQICSNYGITLKHSTTIAGLVITEFFGIKGFKLLIAITTEYFIHVSNLHLQLTKSSNSMNCWISLFQFYIYTDDCINAKAYIASNVRFFTDR